MRLRKCLKVKYLIKPCSLHSVIGHSQPRTESVKHILTLLAHTFLIITTLTFPGLIFCKALPSLNDSPNTNTGIFGQLVIMPLLMLLVRSQIGTSRR